MMWPTSCAMSSERGAAARWVTGSLTGICCRKDCERVLYIIGTIVVIVVVLKALGLF